MSIERDHHELVVKVASEEASSFVGASVLVGILLLVLSVLSALFVGWWSLLGMLPMLLLEGYLVTRALGVSAETRLRLSSEYLVLEVQSPLHKTEITRIALSSIRKIERQWGWIRLQVEGMEPVQLPCPPPLEPEVMSALQQAIASAPAPALRRVGPPPQALEKLRSGGS